MSLGLEKGDIEPNLCRGCTTDEAQEVFIGRNCRHLSSKCHKFFPFPVKQPFLLALHFSAPNVPPHPAGGATRSCSQESTKTGGCCWSECTCSKGVVPMLAVLGTRRYPTKPTSLEAPEAGPEGGGSTPISLVIPRSSKRPRPPIRLLRPASAEMPNACKACQLYHLRIPRAWPPVPCNRRCCLKLGQCSNVVQEVVVAA